MPLTLAVAGLTASEKASLLSAIKAKAQSLTTAWTLVWEPSDFPENPDGLLYCPKRDEGRRWADRLKLHPSCLLLAALPPLESTPSEVPLFVRMPFKPQDIVDALNLAAKRIQAHRPADPLESVSGSREEKIDIHVAVRGASRVDPLALALYAIFHQADKSRFYKIKQAQATIGKPSVEIWCWPDLGLYWSALPEAQILAQSDAAFELYHCLGKRDALSSNAHDLRNSGPLLWRSGTRAFKTAELLPWLSADCKLALLRWPDLPKEARSVALIRILSRLTRSDATFTELLTELKTARKDLSSVVNGLILSGDLARGAEGRPAPAAAAPIRVDPEQSLFLRALALRCAQSLDREIEAALAPSA